MREDEISLANAKNDQISFKSNLGEIKKDPKKSIKRAKKTYYIILKCITKQETMLLFLL